MVNIVVSKSGLLRRIGISEEKALEVLPQIKAGVEAEEGDELTLEIRADRPDLLSLEGVSRAALGFIGKEKGLADLRLKKSNLVVKIDDSVKSVRPIIVCALAKGLKIDAEGVKQIMQVQEKLTLTHGRRRKKVAIGIHDAKPVNFPLVYKGLPKNAPLEFVPLNKTKRMTLSQVMAEHEKGLEYAFALEGASHYPVILDADGDVISFPPVINSAKTTVTTKTRDLFIDVTGTDFRACNAALNILCHDFADQGAEIYSVKTGSRETPDTTPKKMRVDCAKANKLLGLKLKESEVTDCLRKQRLDAKSAGKGILEVEIPPYRTDFIHWIDLVEEIAIGYGYNNFKPKAPSVFTIGRLSKETEVEEALRDALSSSGFVEQSTYVLTSSERHEACVRIKNPISTEYDALRSALLPKLLETLERNTHEPYPQKIFEIGEVVVKHEGKALTQKRLSAVSSHAQASLSEIAGALDNAVRALGKTMKFHSKKDSRFIEGRCAIVLLDEKEVGVIGEIHPTVLEKIQVQMPCAAFEITV